MKWDYWSNLKLNWGYLIVSFFISFILWVMILGKRDYVSSKNIEVDFIVPPSYDLVHPREDYHVKVQVAGPRMALKKFIDSSVSQLLMIDLSGKEEGEWVVSVPEEKLELPFGVRLLSISPTHLRIQLQKKKDSFLKEKGTEE